MGTSNNDAVGVKLDVSRDLPDHGQDAPIEAAMRADAMLEKGDLDG